MYNVALLLTALPELYLFLHCFYFYFYSFTANLIDFVGSEKDTSYLLFIFPGALIPLATAISSPADRANSSRARWADTGGWLRWGGSTCALSEGLSLSLLAKASSPSRIINTPPPAPSPRRLQRGYTLLTHYSRDNQKVGNFKRPGHGIFLLSSQQAGEIVAQGGRRDSSCRWIVLTFRCLEVWLQVVTFKIPRFCCMIPVLSRAFLLRFLQSNKKSKH